MELLGIEEALKRGCIFYAFTSERKLRVVRLQNENVMEGYGEHLHFEDALAFANEDCCAGGRPYGEVYGKMYPNHLNGSREVSSAFDAWILNGFEIEAWWENDAITVQLLGLNSYLFSIVKTGVGKTFFEAANNALLAHERVIAY